MSLTVYVTDNYEAMSILAADTLVPLISRRTRRGQDFRLGLEGGSTPTDLYRHIAKRQSTFKPGRVSTRSLAEYVGLPGETPKQRSGHPRSYESEMNERLFCRIPFRSNSIPPGSNIEIGEIDRSLEDGEALLLGKGNSKAVVMVGSERDNYMKKVEKMKREYIKSVGRDGGTDWWILEVEETGSIGFHGSGIPLMCEMPLVRLDENTKENAAKAEHSSSPDQMPRYALSMGAAGVYGLSDNIMILAHGDINAEPVARSLLDPVSSEFPITVIQRYRGSSQGLESGDAIYVIDEEAAMEIIREGRQLAEGGIELIDRRT